MGALAGLGLAANPASQWVMTPGSRLSSERRSGRTDAGSKPDPELGWHNVERQPVPRHRAGRLGRSPASAADGVAAVGSRPGTDLPSRRRSEHADVDLGHRDLEQLRRTLAGHVRDARGTQAAGGRQAVRGAGMAGKPALSDDQGHVPAGLRFSPEAGRGHRSRTSRAGASALSPAAVRQRRQPYPILAVQSGGAPPNDGNRWHQLGRWGAQSDERPEGRSPYHG